MLRALFTAAAPPGDRPAWLIAGAIAFGIVDAISPMARRSMTIPCRLTADRFGVRHTFPMNA
ncbi:hypothetical protein [Burkholderia stagnalis]|uniref:hypothetical protein n=1 Tax=Burkholderia stagnalis TaxID=1503054 RepID=UPI0018C6570A|nr:hypothetical protein [Burkholderia stagnalis]